MSKVQETTTLKSLKWVSLGSLALAIAVAVLDPFNETPIGPWLFMIALASYITYAIIHTWAAREAKRAAGQRQNG